MFDDQDFKKSSASPITWDTPFCVEVAMKDGVVGVRDSKSKGGAVLVFNDKEWQAFITGVKKGEFDIGLDTLGS
ncbi:MAG: DUF397 domain-containing protein [Endozoicomonas sp. (ex Botrylloides leachii)]|nr:DUF397 domain-containing protein [Endozoicomonas sp. (ex Botrylloides leachii)]